MKDDSKALEEHLVEGALYAAGKTGKVNVHFTVSTEHRELFKRLVDEKVATYAQKYGVEFNVSFSEQKPSTDTIAADMENKPFRDNGKLLFRPGGHGALIENLNDLDADIVFIKNIDNVVPDRLKDETVASETDKSQVGIEIHSGKNRIVRRIFEALGYRVIKLDRVYFAGLTKKGLRRGDWRYLTEQEVNMLRMGSFE